MADENRNYLDHPGTHNLVYLRRPLVGRVLNFNTRARGRVGSGNVCVAKNWYGAPHVALRVRLVPSGATLVAIIYRV